MNADKNQAKVSIKAKQKKRFAGAWGALPIADEVPHPAGDVESFGLAEEDFLALKLIDGPTQGDQAVKNGRQQNRQEELASQVVFRLQERPQEERDAGDRHQAVKEVEFDVRSERDEDQGQGDHVKRSHIILALLHAFGHDRQGDADGAEEAGERDEQEDHPKRGEQARRLNSAELRAVEPRRRRFVEPTPRRSVPC